MQFFFISDVCSHVSRQLVSAPVVGRRFLSWQRASSGKKTASNGHPFKRRILDSKLRKTGDVIVGEGLAVDSHLELVKLPDLQIVQVSEHGDISNQFSA